MALGICKAYFGGILVHGYDIKCLMIYEYKTTTTCTHFFMAYNAILCVFMHLILQITLWSQYNNIYFKDVERKPQRGEITFPKSHK